MKATICFTRHCVLGGLVGSPMSPDERYVEVDIEAGETYEAYVIVATDGTPTYDFTPCAWQTDWQLQNEVLTVDMKSNSGCFEVLTDGIQGQD